MAQITKIQFEEAQRKSFLRQYLEKKKDRTDLAMVLGVLERSLKRGEKAVLERYK